MPKTKAPVDLSIYTVTLSGTSYSSIADETETKPSKTRKVGYGQRHTFVLPLAEGRALTRLLAVRAIDLSDEYGDNDHRVLAIYNDIDKFPGILF